VHLFTALGEDIQPSLFILPGIGNSGPEHWQTRWERHNPEFKRVQQYDWDSPDRAEWVATLEATVGATQGEVVLVAHSLACLVVAHWANQTRSLHRIKAALLVAVPDPEGSHFPREAHGFSPVPLQPLGFPSLVVASSNDPYANLKYAERCARAWGARFREIGARGHINSQSGLGNWFEGFELLRSLFQEQR
jgi:uncharacterized protein